MNSDYELNLENQEFQAWKRGGGKTKLLVSARSPEETMQIAQNFSALLKPGDAVALSGALGSGKTVFIKGLARGLGLANCDEVKSPTFVLMHLYNTAIPLYHFDLYRLEKESEVESIGFEDFVSDPHAIACVEWAERGVRFFPKMSFRVGIEIVSPADRKITIERV